MKHLKKAPAKTNVALLCDSTFDNRGWIWPGIVANVILDHLHINSLFKSLHKFFGHPELSVIDTMRNLMPTFNFADCTNDGFTTKDVLQGNFRWKVFGKNTLPGMFPDEFFRPLVDKEKEIKNAEHIILSIGGNNFREFLQKAMRRSPAQREFYIRDHYDEMFNILQKEYVEIVKTLRAMNPKAKLILTTQYYPSASQDNYKIYEFMHYLGKAMNIGGNDHDPMDVIQEIIRRTYEGAIKEIPTDNVIVADVTSSLNPYDNDNHVSQIEPSGAGGKKIAKIFEYLLTNETVSGNVYRFPAEFFSANDVSKIETVKMCDWKPKHPNEFISPAYFDESKRLLSDVARLRDNLPTNTPLYSACTDVYKEGLKLADNKSIDKGELNTSLKLVVTALENRNNQDAITALKTDAERTIAVKPTVWHKFAGSVLYFTEHLIKNVHRLIFPRPFPSSENIYSNGHHTYFSPVRPTVMHEAEEKVVSALSTEMKRN